jgi:hypothetical protein
VRPLFSLGAELPRNGHDAGHDDTSDQGVAAPVGRLRVPTTSWGPDVLGVTIAGLQVRYGGRFAFGASVREVKLTGLFRRRPVVNCQRRFTASLELPLTILNDISTDEKERIEVRNGVVESMSNSRLPTGEVPASKAGPGETHSGPRVVPANHNPAHTTLASSLVAQKFFPVDDQKPGDNSQFPSVDPPRRLSTTDGKLETPG